ncbi:MAG: ribonuclease H-like domain-containing protein [Magnetococcales bacterium]|nr:ribonuclease H-like domain-containing protein [Magnetococcales bacterium]
MTITTPAASDTPSNDSATIVLAGDLDQERQERYLRSRCLAVDTETMGLKTRRDRLCLVQMCNEEGVTTLVQTRTDHAPRLQSVLESASVLKVFHFARFDMAALKQWLGIQVQPVFCTKIASRLTRTYTDRHGLKDLVAELLQIELNKEQQSSDWAAHTLTPQQIAYAASDVLHLISLQTKLDSLLAREGRLELARECMRALPVRVALDLAGWEEEDIFAHH